MGIGLIVAMFAFSAAMLVVFGIIESRAEDPIIPLSLFKNSIFDFSALEMFLFNGVLIAAIIFIPLFMQGVKGSTASGSGAIITPMTVTLIIGVMICGFVVSKTSKYKALAALGFIFMSAGAVILSLMGPETSPAAVVIAMILMGLGIGFGMAIFNVTAQNISHDDEMGVVTSTIQFFARMGQTVASSVLGTIFGTVLSGGLRSLDTGNLPAVLAGTLKSPAALSNPAALKAAEALVPADLLPAFEHALGAARRVLALAIHEVFIICIAVSFIALFAVLFMKEVPLRKSANRLEGTPLATRQSGEKE